MIAMSNNPWLDIASYQTSDAYRFKGRDEDITKFYNIIENGHLSVLYAESGIGKTSFLNAGIIPALGEQDYAPIHIVFPDDVFTDAQLDIRQWVFDTIENEVKKTGLEWKLNPQDLELDLKDLDPFLWWRLHACQLTDEAGTVKKPLLIFDQFEEVFIKSNRDGNENLLTSMFSYIQQLSSHNVPDKVLDVLNRLYEEKQIHVNYNRNSEYKIIFSLRKEYLSDFDYWTNDRYSVTELFQNRMYLRPFSREQARQVICDQEGVSALNDVAGKIIESIDPNNHNEVEPFVLSVLCSRLFSEAQRRGKDKLAASDFDEVNVNNIIRDFYEDTISTIVTKRSHVAALETLLVDEDGVRTRIRVNQAELQKLGFEKSYKQKLDDSHLVRIIKINDNDYVELIHDRIAKAIYEKRNEKQKKNRRIGLRLLLVALYLFVLWFTYHNVMESENERFCISHPYTKYVDKTKRANIDGEVPFHGHRGYHCFDYQNLDYLEEVVVSEVNVHLFVGNCPKLERVIIQEGIDSVTLNLKGCPKLSFVSIPHSVRYIGLQIERCPVLFNINIPNEDVEIASWCRISSDVLSVTTKNPRYPWKDGALWETSRWGFDILYMRARSHSLTGLDAPDVILRDTLFVVRNYPHYGVSKREIRKINGLKISANVRTLDLRGMDIEIVPDAAFNTMPNLKEVYLPKTIVEIHQSAFQNCKKLELVNFEDCPNLRRIDSHAFKDCEKLKSVNLSNCSNELDISSFAFEDCQGIEDVSFPQSMRGIHDYAFKSCRSISSIKLPDTIYRVGDLVFEGCIQLRKVSLPCSVNRFGYAFPACVSLKEIELNNNPSFLYNESDSCLLFNGSPCIFNKVKYHTYNDDVHQSVEGVLLRFDKIIDIPQGNKSLGTPFLARGTIIDNRAAIDSNLTIAVPNWNLFISALGPDVSNSFSFLFPPENIKQINFKYSSYPHIVAVIRAIPDSLRQNISIKVPYNCKDWYMYNPDIAGIRSVSEDSYLEAWTFLFVDTLQDAIRIAFGESEYFGQIILGIVVLLAFVVYMLYRERSSRKKKSLQSSSVIQKIFALLLGFVFWYIIYWFVWLTVTSSESYNWNNQNVLQIGSFVIALVISVVSVSFLLYPKESNLKMMNKIADFFRGLKRRITR